MAENTTIEWTGTLLPDGTLSPGCTFNPWFGCVKVSKGCQFCYADAQDRRFGDSHWGPSAPRKMMSEAYWRQPLRWNRDAAATGIRRKVFCASMADVFERLPASHVSAVDVKTARLRLWALIEQTPHLDWLLLTKRPENILEMTPYQWLGRHKDNWPHTGWPPNVWIGTSVEDRITANTRIPELLKVPASVRFLSVEPLLGPVHLDHYWRDTPTPTNPDGAWNKSDTWDTWLDGGIHWVIAGGESGPQARPMHPDWVRQIRDACHAHEVPFFLKQWGEWLPISEMAEEETEALYYPVPDRYPENTRICRVPSRAIQYDGGDGFQVVAGHGGYSTFKVGKKKAGRTLDGRIWNEFPGEEKFGDELAPAVQTEAHHA